MHMHLHLHLIWKKVEHLLHAKICTMSNEKKIHFKDKNRFSYKKIIKCIEI